MKKLLSLALALIFVFLLAACGEGTSGGETAGTEPDTSASDHTPAAITPSPDKYTWYIKDYIGKNCAAFGYTSLGGDRRDYYGESTVKLVLLNQDGTYIDIEDEDILKEYKVIDQSVPPNTQLNLAFSTDSDGEESSLADYQNIEEIVLRVSKVGEKTNDSTPLTQITPSPDRYTWYIADYTGRNLATCGYTSLGGDRRDAYGASTVKLVLVTEDGSYVDVDDTSILAGYVVTGQSVPPNTELKLTLLKDSSGSEYSNLTDTQSIDEIELYVKSLSN